MGNAAVISAVVAFSLTACASGQGSGASSAKTSCKKTNEQEIAALFDRWNDSLRTGDPRKVAANYAQRSVLLPTLSNKPRLNPADKEEYFHNFLMGKPVGKIDSRTIMIDCNSAIDTGLYTFTLGADGSSVRARYTYTYGWDGKQWLITSHHSSLMPETAVIPASERPFSRRASPSR
jgi:uncharacterized protein (TIGR02246 family)